MKKSGMAIIIILLLIISIVIAFLLRKEKPMNDNPPVNENPIVDEDNEKIDFSNETNFDLKMIKETNNMFGKKNYMISPLSIAYALSLLKEGAQNETLNQIENALGDYTLPKTISIKDKVGIANLIFIRNTRKNDIDTSYIKKLQKNYDSEVLFDEFRTPKPVNDWVYKKTFKMIKDPVKELGEDFILGLANAIAIDVEWQNKFECIGTTEQIFTKYNGIKMKTAMMHESNDIGYFETNNAKGIVKDYAMYDKTTGERVYQKNKNTLQLEYVAILPENDITSYLKDFNTNELESINKKLRYADDKTDIYYALPKYTYDFDYENFKGALIDLGIKDVFSGINADLSKMITKDSILKPYVSEAIHKSHIEVSENGTKAAAVTVFIVNDSAMIEEPKDKISIEFNKPFIYLIREKGTNNIWFFGTVYEPMKWDDNPKCEVE